MLVLILSLIGASLQGWGVGITGEAVSREGASKKEADISWLLCQVPTRNFSTCSRAEGSSFKTGSLGSEIRLSGSRVNFYLAQTI